MEARKRQLIKQYWEQQRLALRAQTRRLFAIERVIAESGRADELLESAIASADAESDAREAGDVIQHELSHEFPGRTINEIGTEAWTGAFMAMINMIDWGRQRKPTTPPFPETPPAEPTPGTPRSEK